MKNLAWNAINPVLLTFTGGVFLWAARRTTFFVFPGVCFLALAVWEGWSVFRYYRAGRTGKRGWSPALSLAFAVLALCYVWKAAAEPDSFNTLMAVCWSVLGAAYVVKTVRLLRAEDCNKEEGQ